MLPATAIPLQPWSCCAQPPGFITHPDQLRDIQPDWLPGEVPGTVAAALRANGRWDIHQPLDADASDWWYRTTFTAPNLAPAQLCYLCLDGLATLAEVWLNGHSLLTTDNMFRAYRLDVSSSLQPQNELVIKFRSLLEDLQQKRPRPRWKTRLVNQQQLRWQRTTLLGRIPGWSPPVPAVGPWRAVRLETQPLSVADLRLVSTLEGNTGVVKLHAHVNSLKRLESACLRVGNHEAAVEIQEDADGWLLRTSLRIANPPLWWPHTHGEQILTDASMDILAAKEHYTIPCGKIGFRQLTVSQQPGFGIQVNGIPIYCRGACWTCNDIVTLDGNAESLAHDLGLARAAGVNLLRVGGTMVYESDRFYQLCDELGILVWQDFMFANMDYPIDDAGFAANIEAEAIYQLSRLGAHPCVAVYCGNSEVEQQAAMLGMPRELWRNLWFAEHLPALCKDYHPGTAYVPSTPNGGVMPFHVGSGIAHYYGVGGYLRSPSELRQADVKFTPECLAFANIPEPETVNLITDGNLPALHHPLWKQRVPRDSGAGWDFDDVRDFYLHQFFGVDPVQLRSFDMPRYLQLSRVVSGEMMAQVFAEWRSGYSKNRGGLVWFWKDLWPAAGWGIVDSLGFPKAAYYYLRRSWSNLQITLTDEGLDGLHLHVINETPEAFNGFVELLLLRDQHVHVARQEVSCRLPPRTQQTLVSDELLGGFYDVGYAYRFGPPKHDLVAATLYDQQHQAVSEAFHFLQRREPAYLQTVQIQAEAAMTGENQYAIVLRSDRFLQSVALDVPGYLPTDNYFHLLPSREKRILLRPFRQQKARFEASVEALNLKEPVKVSLRKITP